VQEVGRVVLTRAKSTGSPPTLTARFCRSTTSPPILIIGSPDGAVRRSTARKREQLVDSDRVRHVVVVARIER
jgi:hypothetical protein